MIDCLVNAMPNVIYVIAAGGLANIIPSRTPQESSPGNDDDARAARAEQTLAAQYRAWGRDAKGQGRLVEAKTAWLNALELHTKLSAAHPGLPALHRQWCDCANDLAWLVANATDPEVKDPLLALSLALRTTEMDPECGTYWNTLGASYYRTDDFKSAAVALDRSMLIGKGGSAFDLVFLSMTHARLGDREQAHRWLADAMRVTERNHPDHPELGRLCAEARSLLSAVPEASATSL
jgi:uncharacterized protein HemY